MEKKLGDTGPEKPQNMITVFRNATIEVNLSQKNVKLAVANQHRDGKQEFTIIS